MSGLVASSPGNQVAPDLDDLAQQPELVRRRERSVRSRDSRGAVRRGLPRTRSRFTVASSPTRATTISPESARGWRRTTTTSPGRMPAPVMLSPCTRSPNSSPRRTCGTGPAGSPRDPRPRCPGSRPARGRAAAPGRWAESASRQAAGNRGPCPFPWTAGPRRPAPRGVPGRSATERKPKACWTSRTVGGRPPSKRSRTKRKIRSRVCPGGVRPMEASVLCQDDRNIPYKCMVRQRKILPPRSLSRQACSGTRRASTNACPT